MKSTSIDRAIAGILAIALATGTAYATPPSATDVATARELYKAGVVALEEGDAENAATKLAAAWQLAPTPLIGVALARAQIKRGKLVEARESVLAVRRLEVVANETSHSKQARADAETIDADVMRRIAHLHLEVRNAPDGGAVLVDGVQAPLATFAVDRPMNPGAHEVELAWGPAPRVHVSFTLGEGQRKELVLDAPPAPVEPPPTTIVTPETTPLPVAAIITPAPHVTHRISPLVPASAAVLGTSVVVGVIFGALALGSAKTVHDQCDNTTFACGPGAQGALHDAQAFAWTSTIAFGVAGAAAVVLMIGLVVGSHDTTARTSVRALHLLEF